MKSRILFALMLLLTSVAAFAQAAVPIGTTIPTCNSFDAVTGAPINLSASGATTTQCTDYFGKANYANSPLPVGSVDMTGFSILNGGSGYTGPVVSITDFYNTPGAAGASASVTLDPMTGAILSITGTAAGSGYVAPVVTITDPTGTGAVITAKLDPTTLVPGTGIRKFVATDTLPKLPLAASDPNTFPGSDYYEIALVDYMQPMHSDLPPTKLRGYVQVPTGTSACPGSSDPQYLGPVILAQRNRPVRVKFMNCLATGTAGNLAIPVDTTYMGAGLGPDNTPYTENRATLHLHGGNTPWISDGTPHQWTVPANEITNHKKGVSTQNVPDMFFVGGVVVPQCNPAAVPPVTTNCSDNTKANLPAGASNDPGDGNMTFYWTNQQGGRLMFYHDHAYGITRLNVYAGEAAGYLLYDPAEEAALLNAGVPGTIATNATQAAADLAHLVPLVIQDKSFVPDANQLAATDNTWIWGTGAAAPGSNGNGDLWYPHVYLPNQNPADMGGANAFGRWDYGAWFFPPQTALSAAGSGPLGPNTTVTIPCTSAAFPGVLLQPTAADNYKNGCPITPNPSGTPEAFMDTPLVNGKAYPVLHVAPAAYRFRILSAGNDRTLNLSLYLACGSGTFSAAATNCGAPGATGTEVPMVPAAQGGPGTAGYIYPDQLDGRTGGLPDRAAAGPPFLEIGTEGGLLPAVAIVPPTPIGYEYNRRSITVLNVSSHGLMLGPAERADVVVDFSKYANKTLLLYNDAPAPVPAFDSRIDYYTGDPDQVSTGGAPTTIPGYGPNTRTIMQIVVDVTNNPNAVAFSLANLQAALPAAFSASNADGPKQAIVPEPTYPIASGANSATATYGRISDNTITYTPIGAAAPTTITYDQKAIQELFTLDYGRMNATLGTELPLTNFLVQTTLPFGYAEWATEIIKDSSNDPVALPQIWKLTHNGVDTHFIHFHLFNVQVINRIGWDGAVKPPDPNELGWKDTVRMNPLEDIVVALQPYAQVMPFPLPDSVRSLDVTMPDGVVSPAISGIDPATGNAIPGGQVGRTNAKVNFGWEYVWHCHILGHEENDMMRPIIFQVAPPAPSNLVVSAVGAGLQAAFTDNSASETSFTLQRSLNDPAFAPAHTTTITVPASVPITSYGTTLQYLDTPPAVLPTDVLYYRVRAEDDFLPTGPLQSPFLAQAMSSTWSNVATVSLIPIAGVAPTLLAFGNQLVGAPSTPRTLTLSNTGGGALTFSIATTGDYAQTSTCGVSLAGSSSCSIAVTFTPTALLARPGTLVITSNDPVNPILTVLLSGNGTANTTTAITSNSPVTYGANGSVTVNVTSGQVTPVTGSVSLNVDGGVPLTQALVSGSATFTMTALTAGNHSLSANFAAQGGFQTSSATGTLVVNPAPLTITASSATMTYGGAVPAITPIFGPFVLGQNNLTALTTQPTCSTAATSASPASPPTDPSTCSGAVAPNYVISYVPGAVTINKATGTTAIVTNLPNPSIIGQIVTVRFAVSPQITGTPTGNVTVLASTGESCTGALTAGAGSCTMTFSTGGSRTLAATYAGDTNFLGSVSASVNQVVSYVSLSTTALLFGNQLVGTASASQAVTLANVGTTPLAINSITIGGTNPADFSQTNNCPGGTLGVGRNCRINVTFRPTAAGVRTATMLIRDGDVTSPQSVSLTGTGIQPIAALSATSNNFGNVTRRQTSSFGFTLSNTGTAPLTINNIGITGPNSNQFSQRNNCGGSLAVGANCIITVTFAPNQRGPLNATLNLNDNAPGSPQTAALTGTGQ